MPTRGAEMPGVGGDRQGGLGRSLEQQVVDHGLVLIGDIGDRGRQREHHVEVGHREQVSLALWRAIPGRRAPWHLGQWRLRQEL